MIQPRIQIRQKISANTYPTLLLDPGYYTNDEDIAAGSFVSLVIPDENAETGGWFRRRFIFGAVFRIDADGPIRYKEVIA